MNDLDNEALVKAAMRAIEVETGKAPGGFMMGWVMVGPIMTRNNIALSPPTEPVHRTGGPNAGNGQSGVWTACTWHRGVAGRRCSGMHDTDPLKAILRCYVDLILGPHQP